MADPHNEVSLQHCVIRTEHLFAWWQRCNGNPALHRQQEHASSNIIINLCKIDISFLEHKVEEGMRECADLLVKRSDTEAAWKLALEENNSYMIQSVALGQKMQAAFGKYQHEYELLIINKGLISRLNKQLASDEMVLKEIEEETKQLEWFGKTIIQCKGFA